MRQFIRFIFLFIPIMLPSQSVLASPWFTGPILAPAGHTIPKGHTNVELYGLDIFSNGSYSNSGQLNHSPLFRTVIANPVMTHGFTDRLDVQLTLPYAFNATRGVHYNRLGDTAIALGLQVLEQKGSRKRVDFRFLLQETIPTGRYEMLNPNAYGTDSTGLGSYQTQIGLNFQYLIEVYNEHYLRTRLILSKLFSGPVHVNGLNSYGGTINTRGRIDPGTEQSVDLAFEYTLTQNWVAVMEGTLSKGRATRFNGILDIGNIGEPTPNIGNGTYNSKTLAPALEYNFTSNVGLIGGVWFPVSGKNTSHFMTYVLALNLFW